jgi:hypothetical protein
MHLKKMVHPFTQGQVSMVIMTWKYTGNEILAYKIGIRNYILLQFKEKAEEYLQLKVFYNVNSIMARFIRFHTQVLYISNFTEHAM